jgi:hypothetical protein
MGQEFFIKSDTLEDKVRQILPSQGGLGQSFDLSASTQIVPIVDLTESAEGSNLRGDLQTSLSLASTTFTSIINTTTTIVNNTGYFRLFGTMFINGAGSAQFDITDGATTKTLLKQFGAASLLQTPNFDFNVFLEAGDSVTATTSSASIGIQVASRQIATITGELVNP